jgi:hypothetical protein
MMAAKVGSTPPVVERNGGKLQNRLLASTRVAATSAPMLRKKDFLVFEKRDSGFIHAFIDSNSRFRKFPYVCLGQEQKGRASGAVWKNNDKNCCARACPWGVTATKITARSKAREMGNRIAKGRLILLAHSQEVAHHNYGSLLCRQLVHSLLHHDRFPSCSSYTSGWGKGSMSRSARVKSCAGICQISSLQTCDCLSFFLASPFESGVRILY